MDKETCNADITPTGECDASCRHPGAPIEKFRYDCAFNDRFGGDVGICEGTTDNETGVCDACERVLDM